MEIKKIFKNNKKWIDEQLAIDANYFKNLGKGQNPDMLYIGCSDSRVTTKEMMGLDTGDVFVHRNIANMVSSNDLNVMSVIHYAVDTLKVKHIVVCGHYACGGVKAAMEFEDTGALNPWLKNIKKVIKNHQKELNTIENEEEKYNRLVELNVQEQYLNLIKTRVVQKAVKNRGLKIHGWVFDIHTGKLIDLKIKDKTI